MPQPIDIDAYSQLIVMSDDELKKKDVDELMRQRLTRLRGLYFYWLQFPNKFMQDIVNYDRQMFKVSQSMAYNDVHLVQVLLGNIQQASKEFMRWKINNDLEHDLQLARRRNDLRAVAALEKCRIMNNRTDKDEETEREYDKIVPQTFVPVDDPRVIGIRPVADLRGRIRELKKKYDAAAVAMMEPVDADYDNVDDDESRAD